MAGFSHQRENQNIFYIGRVFRESTKGSVARKEILQIGAESIGSFRKGKHIQNLRGTGRNHFFTSS